jgi:polyisoprenoid-binding protein YceI
MSDDHAIIDVHAGDDLSPLAGTWEVDPTHSAIEFVARYAVFTRVRGRFTSFSGTIVIDPPHFEAGSISVDGEVIMAEYDNPDEAKLVLGKLAPWTKRR